MFSKHRIEALSDGIFAIVMTLLILDLKVPENLAPGGLAEALRHDNHAWISFVLTFAIASTFWILQHQIFDLVATIRHETLIPTFLFLGLISVLPFSTSLLGHHIIEPLAFILYFGNQFAIAIALIFKLEIAHAPVSYTHLFISRLGASNPQSAGIRR